MEPVTLITGAIAAGATAALKDTASAAVKDAYSGLKSLIKKRFSGRNDKKDEMALAAYEEDPDTWEKPLTKALVETGADRDTQILEAVNILLQALENSPGGPKIIAKYHLENCEVGIVGDGHIFHGDINVGGKK